MMLPRDCHRATQKLILNEVSIDEINDGVEAATIPTDMKKPTPKSLDFSLTFEGRLNVSC